jgi:hypothetical protein
MLRVKTKLQQSFFMALALSSLTRCGVKLDPRPDKTEEGPLNPFIQTSEKGTQNNQTQGQKSDAASEDEGP